MRFQSLAALLLHGVKLHVSLHKVRPAWMVTAIQQRALYSCIYVFLRNSLC